MSKKESLPVWPLAGPFFIYNEDVKELAAQHRLRIVDANAVPEKPPFKVAPKSDWPKVTIKDEYKPAKAEKAEPKAKTAKQDEKPAGDGVGQGEEPPKE
ncbi:hypothetical protein IP91_00118 [Pseudoduganella lurida]|uniref:Uncharacterized protein n=1 Tax=Pseudoduganella lurida TaxID=1036180 RepID=A0A562RJD9_9BURK|nr:hypothetical protein [Pseudoduganella lurida]TWI69053.1 hypothetical protein IP91_00118 [Pseudoduganella lurida]